MDGGTGHQETKAFFQLIIDDVDAVARLCTDAPCWRYEIRN